MVMASTMGIAALTGSAGAATRDTHGLITGALAPAKKAPPNVDINTGNVFSPTSVTGKKVPKACTKKFSFTISNTSGASQTINYTAAAGGGAFATVPAGDELGVCGTKKFKAATVFDLASNTSSTLTVTIN